MKIWKKILSLQSTMFISFVAGLILGAAAGLMFSNLAKKEIAKGPNSTQVRRHIFHDATSNKYYRFEPIIHVCPHSIDVTQLEHSDADSKD